MKTKCAAAPGRAGGYSFIELLTTLAVAGVLLSTSVPALNGWLLNERRTTVASELLATFALARREGVTSGHAIVVCGVGVAGPSGRQCSGYDWSAGWMIAAWDDTNGNGSIEARELKVLHVYSNAEGVIVKAGNFAASPPVLPRGSVVIKGLGMHSSNGTLTLCDRRGAAQARAVIVSWTGRARVASTRSDGSPLVCS